jgi:hypothetical protein
MSLIPKAHSIAKTFSVAIFLSSKYDKGILSYSWRDLYLLQHLAYYIKVDADIQRLCTILFP